MSDSNVIPFPLDHPDTVTLSVEDPDSGDMLLLDLQGDRFRVLDTWLRAPEFKIYVHKDGYAIDLLGIDTTDATEDEPWIIFRGTRPQKEQG